MAPMLWKVQRTDSGMAFPPSPPSVFTRIWMASTGIGRSGSSETAAQADKATENEPIMATNSRHLKGEAYWPKRWRPIREIPEPGAGFNRRVWLVTLLLGLVPAHVELGSEGELPRPRRSLGRPPASVDRG